MDSGAAQTYVDAILDPFLHQECDTFRQQAPRTLHVTQQSVRRYALIAAFAVSGCAHGGAFTTHGIRWADQSPHRVLYVQVPGSPGNGARLQILDWGGHGDVLLLLPGAEQTAHIFDDFAPQFTDRFHVIGLTRRGQPPSTASADSGYTIAGWVDDIRAAPQARIIELESPHHIFIARQDVVVREMRAFLLAP